jgi:hypothetical protein
MINITTKEEFCNLTSAERAGILKILGISHKDLQDRHKERRELLVHESTIASGVNGRNKRMLDFIADEVLRALGINNKSSLNKRKKVA